MSHFICNCHQSRQLHALDQSIYNLWRLYGYSEAYWRLEEARLNFEAYLERTPKDNLLNAKQ